MFKTSLLYKTFFVAIIVTLVLFFLTDKLIHNYNNDFRKEKIQPHKSLVTTLNYVDPDRRVEALNKLYSEDNFFLPQSILIDRDDNFIFNSTPLNKNTFNSLLQKKVLNDGPFNIKVEKIALEGTPQQFFVVFPPHLNLASLNNNTKSLNTVLNKKPGPPHGPPRLLFILTLVFSLVTGIVASLFLFLNNLRDRARHADQVISQLKQGKLDSRIVITKMDEMGKAMLKINEMAEEIEKLVNRLKKSENTRMALLRELAHDLRTPIASLKNLLEIVNNPEKKLSPEKTNDLLETALKEVHYFEHLVNDLLFLGSVTQAQYNNELSSISLKDILKSEIDNYTEKFPDLDFILQTHDSNNNWTIKGNEQILKRLFRNALDNASSFAKSNITIYLNNDPTYYKIDIQDDGPGIDTSTIEHFGEKKYSRAIVENKEGRISLGLGSVIMKSIVENYGGTIKINNAAQTRSSSPTSGAVLSIILKKN